MSKSQVGVVQSFARRRQQQNLREFNTQPTKVGFVAVGAIYNRSLIRC
jgi:hypothetical protein